MIQLSDPVNVLKGINEKYSEKLENLNIRTVKDLLYHFPFRYEDTSKTVKIKDVIFQKLEEATIIGKLESIKNVYTRSRMRITNARFSDETGTADITWFNQPYLAKNMKVGDSVIISGKCTTTKTRVQFKSPQYEVLEDDNPKHLARISPIYPQTEGVFTKWLRTRIKNALEEAEIKETLSGETLKRQNLIPLKEALYKIHFPENDKDIVSSRDRLGFEELYQIQLEVIKRKSELDDHQSFAQKIFVNKINTLLESTGFKPTNAQIRAIQEISSDISKSHPMNRMLEGDVGSGKTLVAAGAALNTILNKRDVVMMAPTTILAEQHERTFHKFLDNFKVNIVLVTNQTSKKIEAQNKPTIFIGTQALLFKTHVFNKVGLLIVDEQHRFGVKQREMIALLESEKKVLPHFLTMTATPIPRTMALTLFGDIDLSILDELPPGRIPIETFVVPENKRLSSYEFVRKEIKYNNSQAFLICPLVDESDKETMKDIKSVTVEFKNIKKIFPELKIELVHGKVKDKEKSELLTRFKNHEFDVLVSTSVVEVGIDIPDAAVILIESAERFGLAQLHQLRGRVGRNDTKSYCLLYTSKNNKNERLEFFSKHNKGIELAEFDLQNRGPGEVYGYKQSGLPNLKIANILDIHLVKRARNEAMESVNS